MIMKKMGKKGRLWIKTRKQWLKENPPNFEGYYVCYLCGVWVPKKEITLDHVLPRTRGLNLLTDFDNLRPCCGACNSRKGSKVYD